MSPVTSDSLNFSLLNTQPTEVRPRRGSPSPPNLGDSFATLKKVKDNIVVVEQRRSARAKWNSPKIEMEMKKTLNNYWGHLEKEWEIIVSTHVFVKSPQSMNYAKLEKQRLGQHNNNMNNNINYNKMRITLKEVTKMSPYFLFSYRLPYPQSDDPALH